jgi:phosphate acetyltransferase
MANSILVTATQRGSGKSAVALGMVSQLERSLGRVSYFKPIGIPSETGVDPDVQLMKDALGLPFTPQEMAPVTMDQVAEALANSSYDQLLDTILDAYKKIADASDFVVCEGTDYFGAMASFEFNINADLSKNLGAPILLVANARDCEGPHRTDGECCASDPCDDVLQNILTVKESFDEKSCDFFGVVINRAPAKEVKRINDTAAAFLADHDVRLLGTIASTDILERPRLEEIAAALHAEVLSGHQRLNVTATDIVIAAMSVNNVLSNLQRGSLVVVPGDRDAVLLGVAAAYTSPTINDPSGVVITGGLEPGDNVNKLVLDLTRGQMPILKVSTNTFETAIMINEVKPHISAHQRQRVDVVKGLVERYVDVEELVTQSVVGSLASRITPKRFIHGLIDLARSNRQHIVLPEGTDERILRASGSLLARKVVDITLLGDEAELERQISQLGLTMDGVKIIDPTHSELREPFAKRYMELRKKKAPIWEHALDLMSDVSYFGTMMVKEGKADGMVSGAAHTTAHTLRPALEFVKTKEGVSIASSVFFMCLPDSVLVYGDCAVNPNPTAEQLADIALASAETAQAFDIEPRVAMLSYSTGESGTGSDVEVVRQATALVKERNPKLLVEGPIQYDAAVDANVAKKKLPGSKVAGRATVFIFPDLNTGNNTYKAVQRSAGAIAIGPVMQGLRMPVNDLSRGCSVPDIVNTVAITAIQAQRN